jgi:hypothetical protein
VRTGGGEGEGGGGGRGGGDGGGKGGGGGGMKTRVSYTGLNDAVPTYAWHDTRLLYARGPIEQIMGVHAIDMMS